MGGAEIRHETFHRRRRCIKSLRIETGGGIDSESALSSDTVSDYVTVYVNDLTIVLVDIDLTESSDDDEVVLCLSFLFYSIADYNMGYVSDYTFE
ncbi:MAG: hypothetical protein EZS28_012502 [Streblomastix strix]|uniref:Uncharacterized protein n=1 Tax=Streblomastix strix TaxID=222440 RepID=A0A5J4WAM7_9EUKA|nr:MAG: hypothetical protein EZS28_012502 [Streblomastix strix]